MTNYYLTGIATTFSLSLFLTLAQPIAAAASTETPITLNEKKPGEKIPLKNSKLTRNNASVKIYPDIVKRLMHVIAKEKEDSLAKILIENSLQVAKAKGTTRD